MKKPITASLCLMVAICNWSCQNQDSKPSPDAQKTKESPVEVPETRNIISDRAIAEFKEKTGDTLNNWYFLVQLFETSETFQYRVKLQFEEIKGEDTIRFPNFGIWPNPQIRKGKDKFSCIIGFLDQENKFREYKSVSVKDGRELKISTLAHYAVVPVPDK